MDEEDQKEAMAGLYLVVVLIFIGCLGFITDDPKPIHRTWQVADTLFISNGVDTVKLDVSKIK